ncbi:MAG: hypothetical protein JWM33_829 [Caulobacteraceae bacterium]|nr:hypothetical protein [Caulobacteraceae bacterium]
MKLKISMLGAMAPIAFALAYGAAAPAHADLVLETETAQMGTQGHGNFSNALQYEKADGGKLLMTETQLEFAPTDHTEVLLEPFFYERLKPDTGGTEKGMGDFEVTYSWMAVTEDGSRPSIVLAQKVKLPTAKNRAIGTGKLDYQSYVIIGKTWGQVELNANLGYEWVGKTAADDLKNQVIADLSLDFPVTPKTRLFLETFGNSKPTDADKAEYSVGAGLEHQLTNHVNAFVAAAEDNNKTTTARIGLNYGW